MNLLLASLLFTIIFHLSLSPLVKSDATLVDSVCSNTPYPKDCHSCFAGDPGTAQMTVYELAGAAMYCSFNQSEVVHKAFVSLAGQATDPNVKGVYDLCGTSFDDFVKKLSAAMAWWWSRDYGSANKEFDGAKSDYESCQNGLSKLGGDHPLPSEVSHQFEGVNRLYSDSKAIIVKFKANRF